MNSLSHLYYITRSFSLKKGLFLNIICLKLGLKRVSATYHSS